MHKLSWIGEPKISVKGTRWRNSVLVVGGVPGLDTPAQITGATGGIFQNQAVPAAQFNLLALGSGRLEQVRFWVRAKGWVKLPAGTYTATMVAAIYGVAGAAAWTAAAGNQIAAATSLSITQAGTTAVVIPFVVEADLDGDSTSGQLEGVFEAMQNNVLTARTAITHAPTGIVFTQTGTPVGGTVPSEPPLQFAAGVTLTNGQAGAICNLGSGSAGVPGLMLGAD